MSDQRLQNLETVVRALRDEVRRLSDEIERLSANGVGGLAPIAEERSANGGTAGPAVRARVGTVEREIVGTPPTGTPRMAPPEGPAAGVIADSTPPAAPSGSLHSPIPNPGSTNSEGRGGPPVVQDTAREKNLRHRSTAKPIKRPYERDELNLEALVGRYGTLAVAAVLVVMGVGAFVTWAATRFVIGPAARVALGAAAAVLIALIGRRVVARGAVTFGSTLLALALAIAHVDAWAAGPVLQIVPNTVALGAAALASVALAALAIRERSQMLFAVGLGGALIAPFVTSDANTPVLLLLSYGWVVIASALAVAKPKEWVFATYMVAIGGVLYASASVDASGRGVSELLATGLFPLACAWAAFLWGSERRRVTLSLWFAALGAFVALALAIRHQEVALVAVAVLGTASIYAHSELRAASGGEMLVGLLLVPLAFLMSAFVATEFADQRGVFLSLVWAVAAIALTRVSRGGRDLHFVTAAWAAVAGILFALHDAPVGCVIALAAAAAAIAYVAHRHDSAAVMVAAFLPFALGALWSNALLFERQAFEYVPFLTSESLAAASVAAAGFVGWRLLPERAGRREAAWMLLFALPLFFWIRAELVHAIRPEVATFSLILFYAIAGALIIAGGRRWAIPQLRFAGLALAIYAAVKAVVQASGLTMIGLQVGSYLLVGGFLLAVAYWYRAASASSGDQSAMENQQSSTNAVGM